MVGWYFIIRLDKTNGLRDYTYTFPYQISGKTVTPGGADANCTSDPYFGKKIAGGYYVSGEASYIQKVDKYYYLFMSYGGLTAAGGYQIRVFVRRNQTDLIRTVSLLRVLMPFTISISLTSVVMPSETRV